MTTASAPTPITSRVPLRITIERSPRKRGGCGGYSLTIQFGGFKPAYGWCKFSDGYERLIELAVELAGVSARAATVIRHDLRVGLLATDGRKFTVELSRELMAQIDAPESGCLEIPPSPKEVR